MELPERAELGVEDLRFDAVAVHRRETGVRLPVPGVACALEIEVAEAEALAAAQLVLLGSERLQRVVVLRRNLRTAAALAPSRR